MIQKNSKLIVADNSGAKLVKCIHIFKKRYGSLGDFGLVVLYIFNRKKKLVKKKKYMVLFINLIRVKRRRNGHSACFSANRAIMFFEKISLRERGYTALYVVRYVISCCIHVLKNLYHMRTACCSLNKVVKNAKIN